MLGVCQGCNSHSAVVNINVQFGGTHIILNHIVLKQNPNFKSDQLTPWILHIRSKIRIPETANFGGTRDFLGTTNIQNVLYDLKLTYFITKIYKIVNTLYRQEKKGITTKNISGTMKVSSASKICILQYPNLWDLGTFTLYFMCACRTFNQKLE